MNLKTYIVVKHFKSVIVRIPLLQFNQFPQLQKIKITSEYFDVRNDIHKIKNL